MSGFTFGNPATTTNAPTFGLNTQPVTAGLGGTTFGTAAAPTAAATTTAPTLNFSFGQPSATTLASQMQQPTGITFGAPVTTTAQPSAGLTLFSGTGVTAQQTAATTAAGLTLSFSSTPVKPAGGVAPLNFGTPTTSTTQAGGLQFGTATSNLGTATTSLNPAAGLTFGTVAPTGGITFGGAATTAPALLSTNLTFGPASTTTPAKTTSSLFPSTAAGKFVTPLSATTNITTAPAAAVTTNRGLGGVDISVTNKGLAQGSSSTTAAKENLLPNELMQTIDSFKEFVKTQKSLSSDIAKGSSRPLNRCSEDTSSLMELLTTLAGNVQRDRLLADKLKQDTAKALQNAEISQRTHDIPAGLQYENNAPLIFFMELANNFEHDLVLFKNQIETTEKHIQTMMTPKALTPQELTLAMSKLHESLVAVAGKLQGVHSKVQQQKEQYLNFRKYVLKDSTNVFDDIKSIGNSNRSSIRRISSGPTPFSPGNRSFLSSTTYNSSQPTNIGNNNPLAWGNSLAASSSNILNDSSNQMKPPTAGLNFNRPSNLTAPLSTTDSSSFQLQKPPVGNKRGKY